MTTATWGETLTELWLGQLEAAAADPAHPAHEASTWTLRRYRELRLQQLGELSALRQAITECRALTAEDPQP